MLSLLRNLWALTAHHLTAESWCADRLSVWGGLSCRAWLVSIQLQTLIRCLPRWRDCQSYLSQLCLAIRSVVPSLASSIHKLATLKPLALNQIIRSLYGCFFFFLSDMTCEDEGRHSQSTRPQNWHIQKCTVDVQGNDYPDLNIVWKHDCCLKVINDMLRIKLLRDVLGEWISFFKIVLRYTMC